MTDLTADLTRICEADNAQADHTPASVARALYLQRRVTALEQQNQALRSRVEYAELVADRALDFHTGTGQLGPLKDAMESYAASKGYAPADIEWDFT
jgi:hypothetical protein